jgi:hypothetical protein
LLLKLLVAEATTTTKLMWEDCEVLTMMNAVVGMQVWG